MATASELPDILSAEFAAGPYSAYRVLREEAPLLWHAATRSYVISRYEDVARAFREPVFTTANYDWQIGRSPGLRTGPALLRRGEAEAEAEVEIGTGLLLDAMPEVRLADGAVPVERGVFTRGPVALPLTFTPAG